MTIQQLIVLVDAMYPSGESDTIKVAYMNMAQAELSEYFGLIAEDTTLNTVADNDTLTLPTGIADVSQIISFDVSNSPPDTDAIVTTATMKVGTYTIAAQPGYPARISVTHTTAGSADTLGTITIAGTVGGEATTEAITPIAGSTVYGSKYFTAITSVTGSGWVTDGTADSITVGISVDRYDVTEYMQAHINDAPYSGHIYYQIYSSAGVKSIVLYPAPSETGCNIRIRYRKALTDLSSTSLSSSPDFDSRFHDMLALYCCFMIASTGASPDTTQANRFAQQYAERVTELWKHKMMTEQVSLKRRRDNVQWH